MSEQIKATIGFVSGGAGSMPHYSSFLPLIPDSAKGRVRGIGAL